MEPAFSSWPSEADEPPQQPDPSKDKPKKPRHRHTAVQLAALNELYDKNEYPSLDERTALAERLGMETKTVNAWFQNKRASNKKRHRGGAPTSTFELPPISSLLASTRSPASDFSRHGIADDYDSEMPPTLPPPRLAKPESPTPHIVKLEPPQQQTAFYAGNPEHRHTYESSSAELPSRPRMRMRPSSAQTEALRKFYLTNPHPSKEEREELGKEIGMRYQSVTNWFQNQRSLAKKRQDDEPVPKSAVSDGKRSSSDVDTRSYPTFPPASGHPSLPPRASHPSLPRVKRETRSPSVAPSNASAPSRASPYHSLMPSQRPRRTRPEPHQLEALQNLYNRTSNPSIEERGALALEVGMDLAKVTNWFRNLRQTARKRAQKPGEYGDADSVQLDSASVSRAATPSYGSSSSSLHEQDHEMDTEADEAGAHTDGEDDEAMRHDATHSDIGTDEDYQEAVTPSPEHSPPPEPPSYGPAYMPNPRSHRSDVVTMDVDPVTFSQLEKIPGRLSGVKVEDALLLLGFHNHIVH